MDINYAHFYLVNQFKSSTTKAIENKNYNIILKNIFCFFFDKSQFH